MSRTPRLLDRLRLLVTGPGPDEDARNMSPRGAVNRPDERKGELWDPAPGDIYIGSGYFESDDGVTEAIAAASETDYDAKVQFMDDMIAYLTKRGETFREPGGDQFVITDSAIDAIADFVSTHAQDD